MSFNFKMGSLEIEKYVVSVLTLSYVAKQAQDVFLCQQYYLQNLAQCCIRTQTNNNTLQQENTKFRELLPLWQR